MHIERRDALEGAGRRARRARRTAGRVFVSALGFALAYYFDAANGSARRRQLRAQVRAAVRKVDALFAPDGAPADAPPVSYPLLHSPPARPTIPGRQPQSKTG